VNLYNAGQWQAAISKIEEREKLTLPDPMRSKYLYAKGLAYEKGSNRPKPSRRMTSFWPSIPKQSKPTRRTGSLYLRTPVKARRIIAVTKKLDKAKLLRGQEKPGLIYAESLYAKKDDKRGVGRLLAAGAVGADPAGFAAKLFELRVRQGLHAAC